MLSRSRKTQGARELGVTQLAVHEIAQVVSEGTLEVRTFNPRRGAKIMVETVRPDTARKILTNAHVAVYLTGKLHLNQCLLALSLSAHAARREFPLQLLPPASIQISRPKGLARTACNQPVPHPGHCHP